MCHLKRMPFAQQRRIEFSRECERYGGICTVEFSQLAKPIQGFLDQRPAIKRGICAALVNRWMVEHAHNGGLWRSLQPKIDGGRVLNPDVLHVVMAEQEAGLNQAPFGHLAYIEHWLNGHEMERVELEAFKSFAFERPCSRFGGGAVIAWPIFSSIQAGECNYYLFFALVQSNGIGHAIGVHVEASSAPDAGILLFDPDYGEFRFPGVDSFNSWLFGSWWSWYQPDRILIRAWKSSTAMDTSW